MSCRTGRCKKVLLFCTPLAMAMIIALPQAAFAAGGVDDRNGVFQLEGDAVTTGTVCFGIGPNGPVLATPSGNPLSCPSVIDDKGASVSTNLVTYGAGAQDWDKINDGSSGVINTGIGTDLFNSNNDTIFTGGSTKDTIDFSQWLWKNGKPQPKDDFEHAYAAAYTRSSDGHTIIVAGADRYDNSGSSTAGFWFVQDPNVASGVVGSCGGSGCAFGGTHKDGDILVIAQFTIGGAVSTIQIFTWNGDGAAGSISAAVQTGTQCDPRSGVASPCGTVNGVPVVTGGWSFSRKTTAVNVSGCTSATPRCMDTGEFLEIGFDLTALFQGLGKPTPCISTFFSESRSSGTGLTSTLSDFVGPLSFPLCSISDTKSCHAASINSDGATATYQFDGSISATGGTLTSVSVTDHPDNDTFVSSGTSCQSNGTGCGVVSGSVLVNGPCSQAPTSYTTHNCSPGTSVTSVVPGTPVFYSGSFVTNSVSDTLPNTATASGVTPESATLSHDASWLTGNPATVGAACHIAPSGCLTVAPACSTTIESGNPLSVTVSLTGSGNAKSTITNNANVTVSGITVTDSGGATNIQVTCVSTDVNVCSGTNGSLKLAPLASAIVTGSFVTSTCTTGSDGRCTFADSLSASGTGALGAGTIDSSATGCSQPAHCHLCPANTCSLGD